MLFEQSVAQLSEMLEKGQVSAVEIARAHLDRIDRLNGSINAYITVNREAFLADAAESDRRRASGSSLSVYDGIPVAVKDNISVTGMPATCASKILENYIPPYDATVVEKLKGAGFLIPGKTNMDEFAMGSTTESSAYGITKNPFDPERVPGGSSGGSAAAVAAMMAPAALGSDTGGSIRQPASFCGVAGVKPTYGRVSRYGLIAYASSLDQIGTFGRTVDDAASMLAVISGPDKRDSTSIDREIDFRPGVGAPSVKGLRIGVPEEYFKGVDPEVQAAIDKQIKYLESEGAVVLPVSLKYTEYAIPVYYLIATAEASSNLARYDGVRYGRRAKPVKNLADLYYKSRSEGFGTEVKRRIILGTFALSSGYYDAYYLKALKGRALIIQDFREAFSKVDAIVSPVTVSTAFRVGEMTSDPLQMYISDLLTISANLAGIPGISVPVGLDSKGLPIGMQIMADHFMEKTIFTLGKKVEENCQPVRPEL
jgi:aspartyl-tRNA(Asn)/glutamyl-tRNA(Gln) amidotransferase subunit A